MIVETKEKNYYDLKKFTFIISWIAGFCSICFLCLFQPFMDIWVGKSMKLEFGVVICLCIYYFLYEINQLLNTYKDAAGMWHEDRWRPLITALANLGMNVILVKFWGIYGVILSTVLSMILIGTPWLLHNIFTVIFDENKLLDYLRQIFRYVVVTLFGAIITYLICLVIVGNKWFVILGRMIICCIVPNVIYLFIYRNNGEFKDSIILLNKITKGKILPLATYLKKLK